MQSNLSDKLAAPRLHVGIIMDGNGRWASRRGLPRLAGHDAGVEAIRRVMEAAPEQGVGTLTLYAFSCDNWRRPEAEVIGLMALLRRYLRNETRSLVRNDVRLSVIGRRDRLPDGLADAIGEAEAATARGQALHMRIAIDYSARDAILKAASRCRDPSDHTRAGFAQLVTGEANLRDVDLVIRTSGEKRLSDFLLWESAYAELHFTDVMWPDFGAAELAQALACFHQRERRFGGLQAQSAEPALMNLKAWCCMRILLINVPHPSIGSRIPDDHLPPLGLLSIGGPLIDDGHDVRLIDGEFGPMSVAAIVAQAASLAPNAVLFGHSGSTSGHPVIAEVARAIADALPRVFIVYGGVFPTYHWREILTQEPYVTAIVRGEGEETARQLMSALEQGRPLDNVPGIALRDEGGIRSTRPAAVIQNLDAYRVGWELIDHRRYSYWGGLRAVVVQFSRGCPHLCNYCGQRGFWTRWRHRDPVLFARELARLNREHGVKVINFADENPTVSKKAWRAFLEALISEKVDLILVGSTRADDIVRDADILHLYKQAGWQRFLLGMENTDEKTLELIRKGATTKTDREAIRLMRKHGILSMATWVVGFEEETDRDHWRGLKQLIAYDPDQIQMLYVTPHRWTPYFKLAAGRRVIQTDRRRWDYKHQVLATRHMSPWRVLLWFKFTEMVVQCRPRALWRVLFHPDRGLRRAMRWYTQMGRRVWPYEILNFLFDRRLKHGPTVAEFWGAPQAHEEESMIAARPERRVRKAA